MRAAIRIADPTLAAEVRGLCRLAGLTECPAEELLPGDVLLADAGDLPAESADLSDWAGIRTVVCAAPLSYRDLWEDLRGTAMGSARSGSAESAPPLVPEPDPEPARKPKKRQKAEPPSDPGPEILLDEATRTVRRGAAEAVLTPREFALFACLVRRAGEAVPREVLLAEAWADVDPKPAANAPDVTVGYVRRKLAPLFGEGAILAKRGVGYVWTGGIANYELRIKN